MKTFKDWSDTEIRNLMKAQTKALLKSKKEHKINSMLLFGICDFGCKILTNIKEIPKVTKLFSDTDEKTLEKYDKNNIFLFLQDYKLSKGLWDKNNYSKIYKHILENKQQVADKIKNYDYVIICTSSNNQMDICLAEAVADICAETNKRFMICHSTDIIVPITCLSTSAKYLKTRCKKFINKMKKKKYLLNEIIQLDTFFVCDKAEFEYKGKTYQTYGFTNADLTYSSEFNCKIFANTVEYNIIKMLEV